MYLDEFLYKRINQVTYNY